MSVDDPGGEVVILGAGFSYAASSAMLLVKGPGDEMLERLGSDGENIMGSLSRSPGDEREGRPRLDIPAPAMSLAHDVAARQNPR